MALSYDDRSCNGGMPLANRWREPVNACCQVGVTPGHCGGGPRHHHRRERGWPVHFLCVCVRNSGWRLGTVLGKNDIFESLWLVFVRCQN